VSARACLIALLAATSSLGCGPPAKGGAPATPPAATYGPRPRTVADGAVFADDEASLQG
jgi:hypothetical protein